MHKTNTIGSKQPRHNSRFRENRSKTSDAVAPGLLSVIPPMTIGNRGMVINPDWIIYCTDKIFNV